MTAVLPSGPLDVGLLPGITAAAVVVLLAAAVRALRSDAADVLDVNDLLLVSARGGRQASWPLLDAASARLVPALRRVLLHPALSWLAGQAGVHRQSAAQTDALLLRSARFLVLSLPVVAVSSVLGGASVVSGVAAVVVLPLLPLLAASRQRRLRQEQLDRDLPDFLDVLAVTVTAGVAFRAALARCSERFSGALAEEVRLTLHQLDNGAYLRTAFEQLRARNDSEPLATFVASYLQSEELGAPLAESLAQIADDVRRDSAQRQRRRAARTSPRVQLVTSLVLLPGVVIIIVSGFVVNADIGPGLLGGGP